MKIANGKVVSIHYKLQSDTGETLDSSEGREPLAYLQGHGNIISGLENALVDKGVGDKLKVSVKPEEGYGERSDELVHSVPLSEFEDASQIQVGTRIRVETNHGEHIAVVTSIEDDVAKIDLNHPLAGETLHFDVEIMEVRDATEEELSHGHVHGPGWHHHH